MGAQYQWLQTALDWMVEHGVDSQQASTFIGALSHSITRDAVEQKERGFQELIDEQTPGGMNEHAIEALQQAGVYAALKHSMDSVLQKLEPNNHSSAIQNKEDS